MLNGEDWQTVLNSNEEAVEVEVKLSAMPDSPNPAGLLNPQGLQFALDWC